MPLDAPVTSAHVDPSSVMIRDYRRRRRGGWPVAVATVGAVSENRRLGWRLAALGMLLVSTDSFFVRLADADGWSISFLVAACAIPVQLGLNAVFGTSGVREAVAAAPKDMLGIAALASVSQTAFIIAITKTDVANVVVIVAASPILAAVFAWIVLREMTERRVWIAIGITIVGILSVVSGSLGGANLTGDLLAVLAIVAFGANIVWWRRVPDLNRFVTLALSAAIVMVTTLPFADPFGLDARAYLAIAAMGFVFNPAGRVAHTNAPRFAPAAEVALFTPIETVAATTWAWLAFNETPSPTTVIGGVIVVVGVLYGTIGAQSTLRKDGGRPEVA